jgi:hypothetical protein
LASGSGLLDASVGERAGEDGDDIVVVHVGVEELLGKTGREKVEVMEPRFPSFFDAGAGSENRFVSRLDGCLAGLASSFARTSIPGAGLAMAIFSPSMFMFVFGAAPLAKGTGFLRIDLALKSISYISSCSKNETGKVGGEGEVTRITGKRESLLPFGHPDRVEEGLRIKLLIGIRRLRHDGMVLQA